MTIRIFVEKDSSPEDIETAFQAIALGYRTTVVDYVRRHQVSSVSDLAREAQCPHPEMVEQFVRDASIAPNGKDLDYLMEKIGGRRSWLDQIRHVKIHAQVMHPRPAGYSERPSIPQETDLAITEELAKINWFYFESVNRYLKQKSSL